MIISTKIHIPYVSYHLVERPRIMNLLDKGLNAKLTLILAQAGYGKTIALSEWAKIREQPVAWLSLDDQDNDVIRFWKYVTAAIERKIPHFGEPIWPLFELLQPFETETIITAIINELNQLQTDFVFILDDYHLIKHPAIDDSLYFLITYLPAHVHIYISSRSYLNFPTSSLLAKGNFHQIDEQQLRFLLEEGYHFLNENKGLSLTAEQVNHLYTLTEGWICGLLLVSMSLEKSQNYQESIVQLSAHQTQISDFLLDEVFRHASKSMQDFLMQTSILKRMNYALCEAIVDSVDGQATLEQLEKQKMFLFPLDGRKKWYRYHHLFAEFLQRVLIRTNIEKWTEAHLKAAKWFEAHDFDDEAIEHYIAAKQYGDVLRLMKKNLLDLIHSKREMANRWISMLPDDLFTKQPIIEMLYITSLLSEAKWPEAYKRIHEAENHFNSLKGKIPDQEWHDIMGELFTFGSLLALVNKDLQKASKYFDLIEEHAPNGTFFQQKMWRNRYSGFDSINDHLSYHNDIYEVESLLQKAIQLWEHKKDYPVNGYHLLSYSKLQYEWNDLEQAEHFIERTMQRDDIELHVRIFIHGTIGKAKILAAKGQFNRAIALLDQLKGQIESPDIALFLSKICAEQAYISVRSDSPEYAKQWLQTCGMTTRDELTRYKILEYQVFARVLIECNQSEEALEILERLYLFLTHEDRLYERVKVLIIESIALQHLQLFEEALVQLEEALQLAEPMNYIRRFADEGKVMSELLTAYISENQSNRLTKKPEIISYAKMLLLAMGIKENETTVKNLLTEQEVRIVQLLVEGLTNKEIASLLHISNETVKSHMKNIYRKLDVNNRVQAVQRSKEYRLVK